MQSARKNYHYAYLSRTDTDKPATSHCKLSAHVSAAGLAHVSRFHCCIAFVGVPRVRADCGFAEFTLHISIQGLIAVPPTRDLEGQLLDPGAGVLLFSYPPPDPSCLSS